MLSHLYRFIVLQAEQWSHVSMSINEECGSDVSTQHFSQVSQSTQSGAPAGFTIYTGCGKTGDIWTQHKAFRRVFFKRKVIVWMLYIMWMQGLWSETRFTTASHLPLSNREVASQCIAHPNHKEQKDAAGFTCLEALAAESSTIQNLDKHLK